MDWLPWARARRRRLRESQLSEPMREALRDRVPAVRDLSPEEWRRLEGLIQLFLDDKTFEGLGGLDITDEVRVTIAGQACLLLLGLDVDIPYPGLDVIRVYPHSYKVRTERYDGLVAAEGQSHRLGESSGWGYVVLSWKAVLGGAANPDDGANVVLHEFAHQLDQASGHANGAPVLHSASQYGPWARVLGDAFSELQRDVTARRRNVLDDYGASNPAEFFAVATETFFEQPHALARQEPELYEVLVAYYRQDPATRSRGG
ncbi:MAG: zinc-dependent peptidase [Deltaproteobacteria bacterium]|nr:MAG: zinc-dependent peptidase [Deltaproteobacteria bacterium]